MLKEFPFQNFRGLNRTSDRLNSPPDFLFDLLNGYIKKDVKSNLGVIQQRDGITKVNSVALDTVGYGTTTKIRTVYEAKWNGGSTSLIIRAGTAWGLFNDLDTFDTIDIDRADDAVGQCAMFKNELIMVDGAVARKMTAAGVVSDLSSDANMPQKSDCVWVHRDKVWLNDTDAPMTAYFSKTNSANGATSWTGADDAGTIDLSTVLPDGDRIRAFRTYGGEDSGLIAVICDKYTVIYEAGSDVYSFTFRQFFPTTCISAHALDYVGKDIVYPSRNSLTSIISSAQNDALDIKPLSTYIEDLYRTSVDNVTTTTQIPGAFCHSLNHYYIAFPISGSHQILVYSADVGNFVGRWRFSSLGIYALAERRNFDMLMGSEDYVYKINDSDATDDDGTAIEFKARFPAFYFKEPGKYKKPHDFEGLLQTSADLDLNIDYWYGLDALSSDKITKTVSISSTASFWDVSYWDTATWGNAGNNLIRTSDLLGRGRQMFLELGHSTKGAIIMIPWFILRVVMEGYN